MIKIIKGNTKKTVTKGAFEEFFKPLGYTIIEDKQIKKEIVSEKQVEPKKEVQEIKEDKVVKSDKRK